MFYFDLSNTIKKFWDSLPPVETEIQLLPSKSNDLRRFWSLAEDRHPLPRRLLSGRELMNLRRKRGVLFLNRAGSSVPKDSGQSSSRRTTPMPSIPTLRCDKAFGSSMQIQKPKVVLVLLYCLRSIHF
ncbi:hypothetical protein LINPERPRIM_LOCUS20107 [Linum perenne]